MNNPSQGQGRPMQPEAPQQQDQQPVMQQGQHPKAPKQGGGKAKRKAKNFLLQPLLQVKIGLYAIILSILFSIAMFAILWSNFSGLINSIVLMTDAEDEVREIFMQYWKGTQLWLYLTVAIYLIATVGMSVLYTHKLVGPTIAFRRHIRSIAEGRYNARTYLRKGDAFAEVADELNRLSEMMERSRGGGSNQPPQGG